jgi:hypothetical protein
MYSLIGFSLVCCAWRSFCSFCGSTGRTGKGNLSLGFGFMDSTPATACEIISGNGDTCLGDCSQELEHSRETVALSSPVALHGSFGAKRKRTSMAARGF